MFLPVELMRTNESIERKRKRRERERKRKERKEKVLVLMCLKERAWREVENKIER